MLKEKYKNVVTIEYIDASEPDKLESYPKLKELNFRNGIRLPIVALNGEPAWAGAISFPNIVQELQKHGINPSA